MKLSNLADLITTTLIAHGDMEVGISDADTGWDLRCNWGVVYKFVNSPEKASLVGGNYGDELAELEDERAVDNG